jgi:hypothetical protein
MDKKIYVTADGNIVPEDELTPELRDELGIDENGNRIDDEDEYEYREEYVTEDDIARENGFWVDEDGHWRELPDEDWF